MTRLGGWTWLGIGLSAIWLLFVVAFTVIKYPTEIEVPREKLSGMVSDAVASNDTEKLERLVLMVQGVDTVNAGIRERRKRFLIESATAIPVGPAIIFGIGFGIRRMRRRFASNG